MSQSQVIDFPCTAGKILGMEIFPPQKILTTVILLIKTTLR